LPPHERAWRHPSELPAPRHEPPTRGGRALIVATAAIGLSLVGMMAIRMTPGRGTTRDALVTATSSSVFTDLGAGTFGEVAGAASSTGRRFTDLIGRTLTSLLASSERDADTAPPDQPAAFAVVTPIGSGGLAVTTEAALDRRSGALRAMLPSGDVVTAELVSARNGVAFVELTGHDDVDGALPAGTRSDELTVVAYGDQLGVDIDDDLRTLSVPEAAPIFDADGDLVGLCTIGPDGVEMLPVGALPDDDELTPDEPDEPADSSEPAQTPPPSLPTDTTVPATGTQPERPPVSSKPRGTVATTVETSATTPDGTAPASSEPGVSSDPATSVG
jgi:hypothetical protein